MSASAGSRLCALAVLGACLACTSMAEGRVRVGGHRVAVVGGSQISVEQAPWQVAVEAEIPEGQGSSSLLCGGSILDASHILTAAHCVFNHATGLVIAPEDFTIYAGTSDLASELGGEEQERYVTDVRPHPYYNYEPESGRIIPDDVAVLTLDQPLILGSDVSPIDSVAPGDYQAEGTSLNLTGFGQENPSNEELNGKLYSLRMTAGYSRGCGGENNAVLLCASSPSGTPCNGDSGSALTTVGSPSTLAGVEDDYFLVSGQRCVAGAENAFANLAAPEIQDFLNGSEEPPRAPRGGGAVIREAPARDGTMSCEPGSWSENPTFSFTFRDSSDLQILQQGTSSKYAVPEAEVGDKILCEVQATNSGGTGIGRTPGLLATTAAPIPQQSPSSAAGSTTLPPSTKSGKLSISGKTIAVEGADLAVIRLECLAAAGCHGKLTLTAKRMVRAKGKSTGGHIVTIGAGNLAISGEETKAVKIKLNAIGQALLSGAHGRLTADLSILQIEPGPAQTETEIVHLLLPKSHS